MAYRSNTDNRLDMPVRRHLLAYPIVMASALISHSAIAQDSAQAQELAELRAQLSLLQARVADLESRLVAEAPPSAPAPAMTGDAPRVQTRGGLRVTSADGEYEVSIGGRIHFDTYLFDRDQADVTGTTEFRRARLTVAGKALGWDYKLEQDFAAGGTTDGFRDVFVSRSALGGRITIGQFKPYRSLEELTSSNEITMMERPFSSATGLYSGRQFQQGVGYLASGDSYSAGISVFNLRHAGAPRNEGVGAAARATWAPIHDDENTLHLGISTSIENANRNSPDLAAVANYAGRRGPAQTIATVAGASGRSVEAVGLEVAGSFGPLFFQSEYARARHGQAVGPDHDVDTWYLMGGWFITGEHKPYRVGTGVFGSPRPNAASGAWQLTARYDTIENSDVAGLSADSLTLGLNYFVSPYLRFMFNYTRGDNEIDGDRTSQYALRTQFNF